MAFLEQLNPQQREAVEHAHGPLLVVAGAGTGKTRVITYRIANLIAEGVDAGSILGVTFTNKAADEMRERVERMLSGFHLGPGRRAPLLCTFHSFCARLLRREAGCLGFPSDFTIYDEADSESLVRRILRELNLDPKEIPPSAVTTEIEHAKIAMLDPDTYTASRRYGFGRRVAPLYAEYQSRLRRAGAMDFDDLLMQAVVVLRDHVEVRERWRARFQHLLVDEFQDTNPPQYELVRLLAAPDGNVCVVGDPDQSIYQWRGASIRHLSDFERDFAGTRLVTLEHNYRSTPTILRAANAVISRNATRHPKHLWSERDEGAPVAYRESFDEYDEAARVARIVRDLTADGLPRRQIAVFYRTNAQSRVFEEVLTAERIPFIIVGTVGFYQRKEVKDLVAYLRLIVNPADVVSLERIINVPARGIGQTTLERLRAHAAQHILALHEGVAQADQVEKLAPAARKRVAAFHELLERLRVKAEEHGPAELARLVVEETGLIEMLKKARDEAAPDRIENIEELLDAIEMYERSEEAPTLRGFLERIALLSEIDGWETEHDRVNLMTAHNSKGLEFAAVFVTGLEEDLFPHANSLDTQNGIEEERRLFYVALTRARNRVYLSSAGTRMRFGQVTPQERSRFVDELPEDALDLGDAAGRFERARAGASRRLANESQAEYTRGDQVVHPTFGRGEVLDVAETSIGQSCTVLFENESEPRNVAVQFAHMTKLGQKA